MSRFPDPHPWVRRAPVDLPPPYGDNNIARESLWHAYAIGADEPPIPTWVGEPQPAMTTHRHPPDPPLTKFGQALPAGTAELLAGVPFPHGQAPSATASIERVLAATFGVQFMDELNPYPLHRGYASPRCLYPVEVFRGSASGWSLLDPEGHRLASLRRTAAGTQNRDTKLLLIGRYTRIPQGYQWFRGSLVNLELGFVLRALAHSLGVFQLQASVQWPGLEDDGWLAELGLQPTWEWSLPVLVEVPGPTQAAASEPGRGVPSAPNIGTPAAPEPALADVVAVNREQRRPGPEVILPTGIPTTLSDTAPAQTWAEVTWRRNSGRMPRGMLGMGGMPGPVPGAALTDAIAWLSEPPPDPQLAAVSRASTWTVVTQKIQGYPDGIYRIRAGEAVLQRPDDTLARQLEAQYGYPLGPDVGCDVRHAAMLWFITVKPRQLYAEFGPSAWTWAQYAAGWAGHGLTVAAAAWGLFARPVRAFQEIATQQILDLGVEENITLAAIIGRPRDHHDVLDIRL